METYELLTLIAYACFGGAFAAFALLIALCIRDRRELGVR